MTALLDRPVKERTFATVSLRRRVANAIATVLVTVAMG